MPPQADLFDLGADSQPGERQIDIETLISEKENDMKNHSTYDKRLRGEYIDVTDIAKLVRTNLKNAFPAVKFSVKSSKYAGGSSLRVHWTDGPTTEQVDKVISIFEGKGFDGSIDMAYSKSFWIFPNGTAAGASTGGTTGSMGCKEDTSQDAATQAHYTAKGGLEVSGGSYIFTERSYSGRALQMTLDYFSNFADAIGEAVQSGAIFVKETEWGAQIEGARAFRDGAGNFGDEVIWRHRQGLSHMEA